MSLSERNIEKMKGIDFNKIINEIDSKDYFFAQIAKECMLMTEDCAYLIECEDIINEVYCEENEKDELFLGQWIEKVIVNGITENIKVELEKLGIKVNETQGEV